jgi:hypothetical protein
MSLRISKGLLDLTMAHQDGVRFGMQAGAKAERRSLYSALRRKRDRARGEGKVFSAAYIDEMMTWLKERQKKVTQLKQKEKKNATRSKRA